MALAIPLIVLMLAEPPRAAVPESVDLDLQLPARSQAWSSWRRRRGSGGPIAPGAWERLTLIGARRRGGGLWLLGVAHDSRAESRDLVSRASTTAMVDGGLALGLQLRLGGPMLYAGVLGQVGATGSVGRRTGIAVVSGVIWALPSLHSVVDHVRGD